MNFFRTLSFILVLSFASYAEEWGFRFGKGLDQTTDKVIQLTVSNNEGPLVWEGSSGYFITTNMQDPYGYIMFFALGGGFKLESKGGLYFKFVQGVSYVTQTDYYLNTNLQWPTSAAFGIQNKKGNVSGGIFWQHFSNGTTSSKNRGKDFIGLEIILKN